MLLCHHQHQGCVYFCTINLLSWSHFDGLTFDMYHIVSWWPCFVIYVKMSFFKLHVFNLPQKINLMKCKIWFLVLCFFLQMKSIQQHSFNSIIIIQFLSAREKMLHINDFLRNEYILKSITTMKWMRTNNDIEHELIYHQIQIWASIQNITHCKCKVIQKQQIILRIVKKKSWSKT